MTPRRLLIAEDNKTLTGALAAYLRRAGHQVDVADDGAAALARLEQGHYDAIVLDFNLPRVHGIDVLRHIRAHRGPVPVMLFSALHDAEDRLASAGLTVEAFLPKPFGLSEFEAMIERLTRAGEVRRSEGRDVAVGPLRRDARGITLAGRVPVLQQDERVLLDLLMAAEGAAVSSADMQRALAAIGEAGTDASVDDCLARLQHQLDGAPLRIARVRGLGYCLLQT